jgi:hypothetical protein
MYIAALYLALTIGRYAMQIELQRLKERRAQREKELEEQEKLRVW